MIKEIVEEYGDSVLAVRFRCYCLLPLLSEQACSLAVFPTYIALEYPANSSLPLVLHAI